MSTSPDLFPETLNLEDQFFHEGYTLGVADGQKTSRIEGRIFGLEKGFSKAVEMGKLQGKARVWSSRMDVINDDRGRVAPLADNERLRRHIARLVMLSDPEGLSLENGEDEVSEFDDRFKDARAKAGIVERMVGEGEARDGVEEGGVASTSLRKAPVRVRRGEKVAVVGKSTGEMEDFVGRKVLGGI